MADRKKVFEHDSLQDRNTIVRYLNAITDGLKNGKLTLKGREAEIELEPRGLIRLELRASERSDRSRLELRLTWNPKYDSEGEEDSLDIRSDKD